MNPILAHARGLFKNISPFEQVSQLSSNGNLTPFLPKKLGLIFANNYIDTEYSLGDGPMNDCLIMKDLLESKGFNVFIYSNICSKDFIQIITNFISLNCEHVFIYNSGHGTHIEDTNGDETDKRDECLIFMEKNNEISIVSDDIINSTIKSFKRCKRLTLMSDSCHSGTVFDKFDDPSIVSICSCQDNQTSKQGKLEILNCGFFTYCFCKYVSRGLPINEVIEKINQRLKKYNQNINILGNINLII